MPPSSGSMRECITTFLCLSGLRSYSRLRMSKATRGNTPFQMSSHYLRIHSFVLCPCNVIELFKNMTAIVRGLYMFVLYAFVCLCSPVPSLTNLPLQAKALRFFMPDKRSTTMSGTQCECPAAVKTSNSLWMTT